MLSSELLVLIFTMLWLGMVGFGSVVMVNRINRRSPQIAFPGAGQLLYFVPVIALIAWLLYYLIDALVQRRIKLPVRGPDFYFYLANSPEGYWATFGLVFALTSVASAFMGATIFLVMRKARVGA